MIDGIFSLTKFFFDMKNMKNWVWAALAFCLFLAPACKKDDPIVTTGSTAWPGATVKASFVGQILDDGGKPLEGAAVRVGTKAATTDANGVFILRDQNVNSARAIVTAFKAGYFDSQRTLFVQKNSENRVVIRLLKKQNVGSFSASAGGKVAVSGGAAVDFSANSITKNGQPFSGKVVVEAKWLDPTDDNLIEKMPGALRGLRTDGSENGLQTFGMLAVELNDDAGQTVEIASGQKAKITMPIPASLLADAPATIPLWHFSEAEGIWVEEGSATKIGSEYVGEVAHFSWWNCDVPTQSVKLKMCLTDLAGQPLQGFSIELISQNYGSGWAWLDAAGCAEGLVPANEPLEMWVFSTQTCGGAIYNAPIGPFSADTDLGAIAIDPNGQNGVLTPVVLTGKLVDCSGQPLPNAYATLGGQFLFTDAQGNFSNTLSFCSNNLPTSFTATGFDLENAKSSQPVTKNFAATVDFGTISVCDDLDEYIRFTLDSDPQLTILPFPDSTTAGNTAYLSGEEPLKFTYFTASFNHLQVPANDLPFQSLFISSPTSQISAKSGPTLLVKTDLTSYPLTVGQYLIGTFSGTFEQSGTTIQHTISGSYRVKKRF